MLKFQTSTSSADQTLKTGRRIGAAARPGTVIALNGHLGAGKTRLVQGIALGLGMSPDTVTSPTYVLIAEHSNGRAPLYHMDAYRLGSAEDLGPTGFDEYLLRSDGIAVIEWAERIIPALPQDILTIRITSGDRDDENRRYFDWTASGDLAEELAHRICTS